MMLTIIFIILCVVAYASIGSVVGGYVQRNIGESKFLNLPEPVFSAIGWPLFILWMILLKVPTTASHRLGLYLHDRKEELTRVRVSTKKRVSLEKEVADKKAQLELEQASRELDEELARRHV